MQTDTDPHPADDFEQWLAENVADGTLMPSAKKQERRAAREAHRAARRPKANAGPICSGDYRLGRPASQLGREVYRIAKLHAGPWHDVRALIAHFALSAPLDFAWECDGGPTATLSIYTD